MSTYQLQISENFNFMAVVEYSHKYSNWKSLALSTADADDDDKVLTGKELQDINKIGKYLREKSGKFLSLMDVVSLLWKLNEYKPEKEGQAKRIVLNAIS